ncbi:thioesterase II family protein [Kitasatospora sp. NPDC056327]|uniref:thioesterase II family protein n=1 Tax=Kitasatospora sp. NPDC056327 TaxID=3345785 RepID=UPI0035E3B9AB
MLLLCFPHAGGAATPYRDWAADLDPVRVRVVTRRARPAAPAPAPAPVAGGGAGASVDELAAACARGLLTEQRPFAFLGHSLGALLAFETARALQGAGARGPVVLFASGHVAPHLPSPGRRLADLPAAEFWAEVRALGGTPRELTAHPELRDVAEHSLRAEFRLAESYRYRPGRPLDCRVVALTGTEDDRAPAAGCEAWRLHTTGSFALHTVRGGHFFPADNPAPVLDAVRTELAATVP